MRLSYFLLFIICLFGALLAAYATVQYLIMGYPLQTVLGVILFILNFALSVGSFVNFMWGGKK